MDSSSQEARPYGDATQMEMSKLPGSACGAEQPDSPDDLTMLEKWGIAYNENEETKRRLAEWEAALGAREKRVDQVSQALTVQKDNLEKRKRYLDDMEKALELRRESLQQAVQQQAVQQQAVQQQAVQQQAVQQQAVQQQPSIQQPSIPQPPSQHRPINHSTIHLPLRNQSDRPLDFALIQAQLLQDTTGGQPLQIGGYTSTLNMDDVVDGRVTLQDYECHCYARGLHHGGVIGAWVTTIADQHYRRQENTTTATATTTPLPNESSNGNQTRMSEFQRHSEAARVRARPQGDPSSASVAAGVPVRGLPKGPLAIGIAVDSRPSSPATPTQQAPQRFTFSASPAPARYVPTMRGPLSQGPPAAAAAQSSSRGATQWPSGSYEYKVIDGRRQRVSRAEPLAPPPVGPSPSPPLPPPPPPPPGAANPRSGPEPARRPLPAALVGDLPAFRQAALAHSSSAPPTSPTSPLPQFPPVPLRNPAKPAQRSIYSPVPAGERGREGMWRRHLAAMLADRPYQAGGVFVNGLVLRGRDLPRLVAAMTPREGEILYVVHPWMGEPVAYV